MPHKKRNKKSIQKAAARRRAANAKTYKGGDGAQGKGAKGLVGYLKPKS